MEAPRLVCAATLALALTLTLPALASAARTVSKTNVGDQQIVTYAGDDAVDDVVIGWREQNAEFYWYRFTGSPAPTGCGGGVPVECSVNGGSPTELRLLGHGGDDEFDASDLPTATHLPQRGPVRIEGGPGDDTIRASPTGGMVDGGAGDDSFWNIAGPVTVNGGPGTDSLRLDAASGPVTVRLNGLADDVAGSNLGVDLENVTTGPFDDVIVTSAGHDRIISGLGHDTINAGSGSDTIFAAAGDDTIEARDGWVDRIECAEGADTVHVDFRDVTADCEVVNRRAQDDDNDGVSPPVDCNDRNRFIRPGIGDIPDNGVDDDCAGGDVRSDRDGDGANVATDCDDGNAAIRPGAADRPRNGVDEDCSGKDADWRRNRAGIVNNWAVFRRYTRVRRLVARSVPARGRVQIRCRGGKRKGCPLTRRNLRVRAGRAVATQRFRRAKLRTGAVVELRVSAPETMGKVVRYTMRARKLPLKRELCLPPGARRPRRC